MNALHAHQQDKRRIIISYKGKVIYDEPVSTVGCKHTINSDIEIIDCLEKHAEYHRGAFDE